MCAPAGLSRVYGAACWDGARLGQAWRRRPGRSPARAQRAGRGISAFEAALRSGASFLSLRSPLRSCTQLAQNRDPAALDAPVMRAACTKSGAVDVGFVHGPRFCALRFRQAKQPLAKPQVTEFCSNRCNCPVVHSAQSRAKEGHFSARQLLRRPYSPIWCVWVANCCNARIQRVALEMLVVLPGAFSACFDLMGRSFCLEALVAPYISRRSSRRSLACFLRVGARSVLESRWPMRFATMRATSSKASLL